MADTLTTTTTVSTVPSGSIIATDDAGAGGHVQIVKLALSADGSATAITADANGLEVQGAGTAGTPAGGVVSVQGVASGTVLPVGDNSGSLTVDAPVATPVFVRLSDGSAAIATLPVSAASLPLPSGASTLAEQQTQTTALQLIDDTVYTDGTGTPSKAIGIAGTDGTNPQIVKTDAAGELQVDVLTLPNVTIGAAIPTGTNNIGDVDVLTLPAVTNAGTFAVQVDGSALTALQLIDDVVVTEDAAHGSGDKGVMSLAVRRDANTTLADTTGDYAPLQVDASGSLKVAIISGGGTGGTSATDDAAFTPASGSGTPIMGFADETAPDSVDEGDVGVVRMTLTRALHVNLRDASGTEVSVGGGTQYDEDAAHSSGSKVTGAGIVRKDTATSLAGTDGDYTLPIADANGKLWVNASGVTLTVDGSGVTQPISNAGLTSLNGAIAGTEVQVDVVAALPAGTNAIGKLAANSGVDIGDVDVTSVIPGTGATNLGKAEDAAHSSGDTGVMALAVRRDSAAASSGTDGDYEPLSTDSTGNLRVNVGNTVTVGSHDVTNAGTFVTQENGAALTALQLIDDAVSTLGTTTYTEATTKAITMAAVRRDADTTLVDTTNELSPLQVDANGRLKVEAFDGGDSHTVDAPVGTPVFVRLSDGSAAITTLPVSLASVPSHAVTNAGTFAVQSAAAGDVASDAVDSGNPVKIGALAKSADITAVADADRVTLIASLLGKQIVIPYATPAKTWNYAAAAGGLVTTSGVTVKAAAGAGIRNYITKVSVINSHQTTSTEVMIRDGASGTVLWRGWAQAAGGGCADKFDPPLRGTANTLVEIAEVTTTGTAGVLVNVSGYEAAE